MRFSNRSSLALIILALAVFWTVPTNGGPNLGNLIPRNFEINAMTVNEKGDVGAGSFYAKDQTVIPWNLTNPIYKYVAVTLIVSNLNTSINTGPLSLSAGINILGAAPGPLQFKIILIVQGVQRSAPAIASDVESVFGMQTGSFTTLASNPLNLPVSVFGANLESNPYSNFVGKFVQETSAKQAVMLRDIFQQRGVRDLSPKSTPNPQSARLSNSRRSVPVRTRIRRGIRVQLNRSRCVSEKSPRFLPASGPYFILRSADRIDLWSYVSDQ